MADTVKIGIAARRVDPKPADDLMFVSCVDGVLQTAGADAVFLPYAASKEEAAASLAGLDGLIIPGGADLDPSMYGEEKIPQCGETFPEIDAYDARILESAMERKLPIWGICRGHQFINVYFGGTLWQDIETQLDRYDPGQLWKWDPLTRVRHTVKILDGPLAEVYGRGEIAVNSAHHQAVRDPAPALRIGAAAPDGIVEGLYHPDYPFLATTQWHPEYIAVCNEDARRWIRYFVEKCRAAKMA